MALIECGAGHGIITDAGASHASVGLGTCIAVVAGCAIGQLRAGTYTGCGIAGAGVMALIECRADHGIITDAGASLTGVGLCA